jgi:hypothetical protein
MQQADVVAESKLQHNEKNCIAKWHQKQQRT